MRTFLLSSFLFLASPTLAQTNLEPAAQAPVPVQTTVAPPEQSPAPTAAPETTAQQTPAAPTEASIRDSFGRIRELVLDGCPKEQRRNNGPLMLDIHCGTREQALAFKALAARENIRVRGWLGPFDDRGWIVTADNRVRP